MTSHSRPLGDPSREAIDSLGGYVYQIYQTALAWIDLGADELLFIEVAEDYALVAQNVLNAVQVKATSSNVTINSDDIISSIDNFVYLREINKDYTVYLRHLTTSKIGKEKASTHRQGDLPTLDLWRQLAKTGNLSPLRKILDESKLSGGTKAFMASLTDEEFRKGFLQRINFDCGAPNSTYLEKLIRSKLFDLITKRGGLTTDVDGCLNAILIQLLRQATSRGDRRLDKYDLDKILETATHVTISRSLLDAQTKVLSGFLAAPIAGMVTSIQARITAPRSIEEVPLPTALADRPAYVTGITSAVSQYGVAWVYGAAGVGKTTTAKQVARALGGTWAGINLRNLSVDQAIVALNELGLSIKRGEMQGVLIDDIEFDVGELFADSINYVRNIGYRSDILLIFTSYKKPSADILYKMALHEDAIHKIGDFIEADILQILAALGVSDQRWSTYIHLVSGGGHPQLAVAAIQSMASVGWSEAELANLDALLGRNTAIESVRERTRSRLLEELPAGARSLLERVSLTAGGFTRDFVLSLSQVSPAIDDAGILLDRVIGSWIDQQEQDSYVVSPLLANYAQKSLSSNQRMMFHYSIAEIIVDNKPIDPQKANAAMISAIMGRNGKVVLGLCLAVLGAESEQLDAMAPYLPLLTLVRSDANAYDADARISYVFRGAQLILLAHLKGKKDKFEEILERFDYEGGLLFDDIRSRATEYLVLGKILLARSAFGAMPQFGRLVKRLDDLLQTTELNDIFSGTDSVPMRELDGIPITGFMFLNQASQISRIEDLRREFEFLDTCDWEFRKSVFSVFLKGSFDVDMLVSPAWLAEHRAKTINPAVHAGSYAMMEDLATKWGELAIAIACRRYRAVIFDEYGSDPAEALSLLDDGLQRYGAENSELIRAKAKVLYRSEDYEGSFELSRILIDGGAIFSNVEKAFLGREGGISAEKLGHFEAARRWYLYGSDAARESEIGDMLPMYVGLLADAAMVSWHSGDRETCLLDFARVLQSLSLFDPETSIRAAHCHAVCRHVLLWLDQEASGQAHQTRGGEETVLSAGVVSNPEPHPEIGERFITPIELAWYMLAAIENHCDLELGITDGLKDVLPQGGVVEGQILLTQARINRSIRYHNTSIFISSLIELLDEFIYLKENGGGQNALDVHCVSYETIPAGTRDQRANFSGLVEGMINCFASASVLDGHPELIQNIYEEIIAYNGSLCRNEYLECLKGAGNPSDYNSSLIILIRDIADRIFNNILMPKEVFELALRSLYNAKQCGRINPLSGLVFRWLKQRWESIWESQRFLLRNPVLHESNINIALNAQGVDDCYRAVNLLRATLPTMGYSNESELMRLLGEFN